jgi:hypothetical protein
MAASNEYTFVTRWRVQSTLAEISEILGDPLGLARWWPAVYLDVDVADEPGGRVVSVFTTGWLPYTLRWQFRVTDDRAPRGFSLEAWGDFVGRGDWTFIQAGDEVELVYAWQVRADKGILRRLSFALKPMFAANHRWAMARGEESLRLELRRRHARTEAERLAVPPPPSATWLARLRRGGVEPRSG